MIAKAISESDRILAGLFCLAGFAARALDKIDHPVIHIQLCQADAHRQRQPSAVVGGDFASLDVPADPFGHNRRFFERGYRHDYTELLAPVACRPVDGSHRLVHYANYISECLVPGWIPILTVDFAKVIHIKE